MEIYGDRRGDCCIYVQGVHRGDGFGERLRQMVEDMTEKVAGLRLEDKGEETESRVTKTGANQDSEEAAGNIRTEEIITVIEDEGEIRKEQGKEICSGTTLMATHAYTRNP